MSLTAPWINNVSKVTLYNLGTDDTVSRVSDGDYTLVSPGVLKNSADLSLTDSDIDRTNRLYGVTITGTITNDNVAMFSGNSKLYELDDDSSLNTTYVTTMQSMFSSCSALTSIDLSSFNTEKVTNMTTMFHSCSALTSIDLSSSSFNTGKVTTMQSMFYKCSALTSIDLSSFNTEKVTTMSAMFSSCSALTSIDLSNFNTENVTTMQSMFSSCSALTSIDLSNFNTEKVTRMEYMFSNCRVLRNIIVSENFVISDSVVSENIFFNTDGLNNIFIPTAEVISYNVTYPDKTELRLIGYNDLSDTELTDASLVDATETVTFSGSDSSSDAFSSGGRFRIIPPYSGGGSGEPIEGDSYSSGGGSGEPIEGDRYSSGGGSGDPHIYPIEGDSYELPVKVASYRLLQGDNIFLNVNTRNTTPQESYDIINYYKKNVGNDNIEKLVTEGVFFNDVALMSEGNTLHYSFQSGNGSISTSDYFKLSNPTCSLNKGFENGELMNEIIVSFVHGKYGKISVALRNFRNPQLKYGFGINVQNKNDMEGLLVREYLCDTMEINNIMNTDVVRGTVGVNRYISLIKNIPGKISTRRVLN